MKYTLYPALHCTRFFSKQIIILKYTVYLRFYLIKIIIGWLISVHTNNINYYKKKFIYIYIYIHYNLSNIKITH